MAVIATAISFFVIIIAVAISSGFRRGLGDAISEISGDISIVQPDLDYTSEDEPLEVDSPALQAASKVAGTSKVVPAVYRAGIVKNGTDIAGVLFKGIPEGGDSLGVNIPSRLADMLNLKVGDPLPAYFVGEKVKARKFRVDEIYPSVLSGNGNMIVFAGLDDVRRINGWQDNQVSALELIMDNKHKDASYLAPAVEDLSLEMLAMTPEDENVPRALSAQNRFPQIFSWLDLIDFNVLTILILMSIVAGFNMISGLLILLFRNTSTIGTLKSMGMTDKSISEVFIRMSSRLVLKGMLIGNAVALLFCLIQGTTHFLKLNPDNYFLSYVPVHVNPVLILAADLLAYLVIMILLLIPSTFVARVDPAKTVRAQ